MIPKNLIIRHETPSDYRAVEELTREAFWGCMTSPVCDGEHFLVHKLRKSESFIPALDFVAETDGLIIGHIIYSRAKIISPDERETEVLIFGPLSVLPQYKKTGIGTALMRHSIAEAQRLKYRAVIIYGHPDYYPRFGFKRAVEFGITTPDGKNFDAFMALPLYEGALDGISGRFFEDSVYNIDPKESESFDKSFPPKKPAMLAGIEVLTKKLPPSVCEVINQKEITLLARMQEFSGREIMEWEGVDSKVFEIINQTLAEHGYCRKFFTQ